MVWSFPPAALLLWACQMALAAPPPQTVSNDRQPPVDQAALNAWWQGATEVWLEDTGYKVADLSIEDGPYRVQLDEGIFIPVYSGQKPVSHRMVGLVFIGDGTLTLDFPDRADAWSFANHMVLKAGADPDAMRPIAREGKPFQTHIDRGLILTADPKVERLLLNLEPVGEGLLVTDDMEEGVDAVYVVTDSRGRLKARALATNLLPDRRRLLLRSGLDPVAMQRQDRLLNEELGVPGDDLRLVMDFRTDTDFRVAAEYGATAGPMTHDRWLTCLRDGLGQTDTGYRTMVFSHGLDQEGDRHFRRFSGERFVPTDAYTPPMPTAWMEPVFAETVLESRPKNMSKIQRVEVDSTLTLRARGRDLQYVAMRMPATHAIKGTWHLEELALADGTPIPWVSLSAESGAPTSGSPNMVDLTSGSRDAIADSTAPFTDSDGIEVGADEMSTQSFDSINLDLAEDATDRALIQRTAVRYEIIALLPQPVPRDQEVQIHLKWSADWLYANWSWQGRPLGTTSGLQPILPELLPSLGGSSWSFHTTVGVPGLTLRTIGVAVSGDTTRTWEDVDGSGWKWTEAEGHWARNVGVAIGQWYPYEEPAAEGMPGVKTQLFASHSNALREFPPEARRVVSFLQRFLPDYPQGEVEFFQGPSTFGSDVYSSANPTAAYGLVAVQTVKSDVIEDGMTAVGSTSLLKTEDPHRAQSDIARQIAQQYWGQSVAPATQRDEWIAQALGASYAAFYIRAAFGREAWDDRLAEVRSHLEDPSERQGMKNLVRDTTKGLSLTGATYLSDISDKILADYGLYLIAQMLRRRVGDQAFFLALDQLAWRRDGNRLTTEDLQRVFERTSAQDLSDYFDFWVHGGHLPQVDLEYQVESDGRKNRTVQGCLTSSVPFGTFEVPVRVTDRDGGRMAEALVEVVDGRGAFQLPDREEEPTVELDPENLLLLRKRTVHKVQRTACDG